MSAFLNIVFPLSSLGTKRKATETVELAGIAHVLHAFAINSRGVWLVPSDRLQRQNHPEAALARSAFAQLRRQ